MIEDGSKCLKNIEKASYVAHVFQKATSKFWKLSYVLSKYLESV